MGTRHYLACLSHAPHLFSEEITQHTNDEHYWAAVALARTRPLPPYSEAEWDSGPRGELDFFLDNARRFCRQHPVCLLGTTSSYDDPEEHFVVSHPDLPPGTPLERDGYRWYVQRVVEDGVPNRYTREIRSVLISSEPPVADREPAGLQLWCPLSDVLQYRRAYELAVLTAAGTPQDWAEAFLP